MPDRAMLVVVVVRDSGLRSLLAARLSLLEVEVLTASRYSQTHRWLGGTAVLIVDQADIAGAGPEWVDTLWLEGRWEKIAIIGTASDAIPSRDWLIHIKRDTADEVLPDLIGQWTETKHASRA